MKAPNKPITSRHVESIALFLLLGLVFVFYAPTLRYPFQFDDKSSILDNRNIRITEVGAGEMVNILKRPSKVRPVAEVSFALNYYLGGYNPFGYHTINVLIHLINGMLLYLFTRLTMNNIDRQCSNADTDHVSPDPRLDGVWGYLKTPLFIVPFFSAAIWLVHPLATNSVIYVVQRMNSLAALFYLLAMLLYIKGRSQSLSGRSPNASIGKAERLSISPLASIPWYTGCAVSGMLAFKTKEISATLPFFILLYEWFFFQDMNKRWIKHALLWGALLCVCFLIGFDVVFGFKRFVGYFHLYDSLDFTMYQRVLTEWRVVVLYLALIFFPHPSLLNIDHDIPLSTSLLNPMSTILSLGLIALFIFSVPFIARRQRMLAFAILWFFGQLVIESSILPLDIIFEHRTYLPSMLVVVGFVWITVHSAPAIKVHLTILIACLLVLGAWTRERYLIWSDPVSLWQDAAKKSPGKSRPHINLGEIYADRGNFEAAIRQYLTALTLNPYSDVAHYNIGAAYYASGNLEKSIEHYRLALKSNPKLAEAHNNLGVALIDQKKLEEGIFHYREALRLMPGHPEAPENLRKVETGLKQIDERIVTAKKKLESDPRNPDLLYQLGFLHYRKGKFLDAKMYYHQSLAANPTDPRSLVGLAILHAEMRADNDALLYFKKAAALRPEDASIDYNIACMYARQSKVSEAVDWLKQAVDKGYNNREALQTDRDLDSIRHTRAYLNIINRIQ